MLPWLPENIASYGGKIDSLFYLIFWITTIVFFLVQVALVVFLVNYRHRPGRERVHARQRSSGDRLDHAFPPSFLSSSPC